MQYQTLSSWWEPPRRVRGRMGGTRRTPDKPETWIAKRTEGGPAPEGPAGVCRGGAGKFA